MNFNIKFIFIFYLDHYKFLSKMSDYFDELGYTPTGPEGANDFDRHYKRLQVLAIMNGIDMEIEVPEASKKAIAELPVHEVSIDDDKEGLECAVCKSPAENGEKYKVLPCKHEFHEDCILLWLKKVSSHKLPHVIVGHMYVTIFLIIFRPIHVQCAGLS